MNDFNDIDTIEAHINLINRRKKEKSEYEASKKTITLNITNEYKIHLIFSLN